MRIVIVAGLLALAGCQSTDPFCRSHNAGDLIPTAVQHRTMSPAERRAATARYDAAALRCRWEP